jgi:AraC-like DNA-binding protein
LNFAERRVLWSFVIELVLHAGFVSQSRSAEDGCTSEVYFRTVMTHFASTSTRLIDPADVLLQFSQAIRSKEMSESNGVQPLALKMKRYIDDNYSARLTIRQIASGVNQSPSQARRLFTSAFGVPVHRYLTAVRVGHGLAALSHTNAKVESISLMVGYRSAKDFYRAFWRHTGLRPGDVRQLRPADLSAVMHVVAQSQRGTKEHELRTR